MPQSPRPRYSRREFGKVALVATVGTLVVPRGGAHAAPGPSGPETTEGAAPAPPTEASPEARALAEILGARYPDRLDAAARKEIARGIDGGLQGAARLRKEALANSDEPAFRFQAWRSDR